MDAPPLANWGSQAARLGWGPVLHPGRGGGARDAPLGTISFDERRLPSAVPSSRGHKSAGWRI